MKSPRHRRNVRRGVGFQMLSKQAQERLIKYEYAVIWILVLIAITSIVWSITLNILTGDFNNGMIGAKLIFRERDFQKMDNRSLKIFYQDLGQLINETYSETALDAIKTTDIENSNRKNNENSEKFLAVLKTTENTTMSETTTAIPKKRKISHIFQTNSNVPENNEEDDDEDYDDDDDGDADDSNNTTIIEKKKLDIIADRKFLASMIFDVEQSLWRQSTTVQFVYSFPFITEMMAIVWTAMCLVFKSGVKKYWGLPKPWRIVVPSIFIFTLMTLGTLIYTIIANRYLISFCTNLKQNLSDPNLITCGQAMSVLRPVIKRHQFRHDVYLNLFRLSYILSFLLWALALVIMVLRYVFAIDFQLVDVRLNYEHTPKRRRSSELSAVRVKSPVRQQTAPKMLRVDERSRQKSEEDFQSAKSHLSEVSTPLLQTPTQTKIV